MMSWYIDSSCITSPYNKRRPAALPRRVAAVAPRPASLPGRRGSCVGEEPLREPDALAERVGLLAGVVQVERRAGASLHAERAVQRPGAVMARPHRDAPVVEHLAGVVRVHALHRERKRAAAVRRVGGP